VPQATAPRSGSQEFHLVVIAASAGGLVAVATVLRELPRDFPVPIALVQHIDPSHHSLVAHILDRKTALSVREAQDGDALHAGIVYVAPPARHLEINDAGAIALTCGEPIHFVRPAADRLFATAAHALGRIIGIVLSGAGSDGADGARAIRKAGGIVIAQDQASSAFFGMPQAAIHTGAVDRVLPLTGIAGALTMLTESRSS
jgi:two-component system chemotaxis response regulator CheB